MTGSDQKLAHALKMKFGTSDYEPSEAQLASIKRDIQQLLRLGPPTENDWRAAVMKYCPSFGTHKRAGLDTSDLNTLLALALKEARGQ